MMKASYVMPVMRSRWIDIAVQSIVDQNERDIEILVGDGSGCFKDNPILDKDNRIKRFDCSGMNMSETLNVLVDAAQSDIILHAFDDDLSLPNRTEICLDGIFGCDIFVASYYKIDEVGTVYETEYAKPFNFLEYVNEGLNVPLFAGAYRKSTCPRWDARFLHMNDYCFILDSHRRGLKIRTSKEITCKMRYWEGQLSHENKKNRALIDADRVLLKDIFGLCVYR
jgi:hypothetical protein